MKTEWSLEFVNTFERFKRTHGTWSRTHFKVCMIVYSYILYIRLLEFSYRTHQHGSCGSSLIINFNYIILFVFRRSSAKVTHACCGGGHREENWISVLFNILSIAYLLMVALPSYRVALNFDNSITNSKQNALPKLYVITHYRCL